MSNNVRTLPSANENSAPHHRDTDHAVLCPMSASALGCMPDHRDTDHAVLCLHRPRPAQPPQVVVLTNDLTADHGIAPLLSQIRCTVTTAETVDAALSRMDGSACDLIIVDIRPDIIGYEVVRRLRVAGVTTPVLFISALTTHDGWEKARQSGADAVMALPIEAGVLETRIEAMIRAGAPTTQTVLQAGPVCIVPEIRTAFVYGQPLSLSALEYALLEALITSGGAPLRGAAIATRLALAGHNADDADVGAAVRPLRRKFIEAGVGPLVRAVGRQGYAINVPGTAAVARVPASAVTARAA